ncbi:MAG: hypothetical protein LIO67_04680 [Lachnospiraceae bacterium]|nr:hypothetical protein [Lachnospiraceae bacterium]
MKTLLERWRNTSMAHPRLCMLASWALLWAAGTLLRIPAAATALVILVVGYLGQFIWMMRRSALSGD